MEIRKSTHKIKKSCLMFGKLRDTENNSGLPEIADSIIVLKRK